MDRWTDKQTNMEARNQTGQTDMDWHTESHRNGQTYRQTGKQRQKDIKASGQTVQNKDRERDKHLVHEPYSQTHKLVSTGLRPPPQTPPPPLTHTATSNPSLLSSGPSLLKPLTPHFYWPDPSILSARPKRQGLASQTCDVR